VKKLCRVSSSLIGRCWGKTKDYSPHVCWGRASFQGGIRDNKVEGIAGGSPAEEGKKLTLGSKSEGLVAAYLPIVNPNVVECSKGKVAMKGQRTGEKREPKRGEKHSPRGTRRVTHVDL